MSVVDTIHSPRETDLDGGLGTVDALLRDRSALLERIDTNRDLVQLARAMILTVFLCGAAFGAAVGVFRGGWQILFAAAKLPLAILFTAAVCAPCLTTLRRVVGGAADLRRDLALVLCCLALGSLTLAALTPIVLLAYSFGATYHQLALTILGCAGVAGLAGLSLFAKSLKRAGSRATKYLVGVPMIIVFCLVGAQMSWTLRPYLVRPRTPGVVFIRHVEGSLLDAVVVAVDSSRGVYYRGFVPSKRGAHQQPVGTPPPE